MGTELTSDARITAVGLLCEAYTGLSAIFASHLGQHGLAPIEFDVLLRLARSPQRKLRMTDLSAQTVLTTSGVTRVVDRLARDGLVCRQASDCDRRSLSAVLTEAGLARLQTALPGHLAQIDEWFVSRLTAEELTGLLAALRVIRDAVRPSATAGVPSAR